MPHAESVENVLTIPISGNVSVDNVHEFEDRVMASGFQEHEGPVVLDAENLTFISSAGLRVILRLIKMKPELSIINVRPEVYEIFQMTGFTDIANISKIYRSLSVEGCEEIGHGANGAVYRIDSETIVKVYYDPDSLPEIQRERELARLAFVAGIPTAIPYDVVRVGEGYGSVFEHLAAESFAQLLADGTMPVEEAVDRSVELLRLIHSAEATSDVLPDQRNVALARVVNLSGMVSDEAAAKLRQLLEAMPEDKHLVHGDFHVKNVMLQEGESLLIDMDTLSNGNPIFELAAVYTSYVGYSEIDPGNGDRFLDLPEGTAALIWQGIFKEYFADRSDEERQAIMDKILVVSAIRVLEHLKRKGKPEQLASPRLTAVKARFEEILGRIESLAL